MKVTFDDIQKRESQHVLQTYRRQPVAFVRGKGPRLYDVDGREYLDFVSGIGVASLGHAHPGLSAVIAEQASTLLHTSNLYHHPFQAEAAARLSSLSGLARSVLLQQRHRGQRGVPEVRAPLLAHPGREGSRRRSSPSSRGSPAGRWARCQSRYDEHYRTPFGPLLGPVTFVNPDSPDALAAAVNDRTAAIIAEPIRGEGGVRPLPRAFSDAIMDVCRRTGTLLIADEVQTGLGRTGYPFYSQALGWQPDLISVGKALGSGVPVGAALVSERVAGAISAGDHGSTYGGNLLATRAAAFFLEQLMDHGLIAHVKTVGAHLERRLRTLALKHPVIRRGSRRRPDARRGSADRRRAGRRSGTAAGSAREPNQ